MSVAFTVKYYMYEIGTADFLYAFFSTVAFNLENNRWGSKYPVIMNELYNGSLGNDKIESALHELDEMANELGEISPEKVVWDIEDLTKQPPWGTNISDEITDLSNYFVTSDGEDFLTVFRHALEKAIDVKSDIRIVNI